LPWISPEEIELTISEIRRYRVEHFYTDKQIMEAMKLSRGTYYKYKKLMLEQNRELIKNKNKEQLNEEIEICKARLEQIASKLGEAAKKAESVRDESDALFKQAEVVKSILGINYETPDILAVANAYGDSGQETDNRQKAEAASTQ
jgi:uncharacterized protein YukE